MFYTIENEKIRVVIDSLGGEMMSLQTKQDDCEYLWQGDSAYWSGRAIHLFPICGRLFAGKYTYQGNTYEMGAHGFLRSSEMAVVEQKIDQITFQLTDTEVTRQQYPFAFCLNVTYRLLENHVLVDFQVINTDDKTLIFTLGGHPGFALPLEKGLSFDDYTVTFCEPCEPQKIVFSPTCFLTGNTEPFVLNQNVAFSLHHDLFDQDAIFLQGMSKSVTLASHKGTKQVTLTCNDMKYLGFWHTPKSDAPFVCIEPWLGIPSHDSKVDDWETKQDMIHLPVGEQYQTGYQISMS